MLSDRQSLARFNFILTKKKKKTRRLGERKTLARHRRTCINTLALDRAHTRIMNHTKSLACECQHDESVFTHCGKCITAHFQYRQQRLIPVSVLTTDKDVFNIVFNIPLIKSSNHIIYAWIYENYKRRHEQTGVI